VAELYFQNLTSHRPDVVQRATYESLQAFYKYLEHAKKYLERVRYEVRWAPLGIVVRLEAPRGTRDPQAFRADLERALSQKRLSLCELRGPALEILTVRPHAGVVVLDAAPREGAELELRGGDSGQALRALAVAVSSPEERVDLLGDGGEVLVNTRMEDELLVVDRVSRRLTLRSGSAVVGLWNEAFDLEGLPPAGGTTVPGVQRAAPQPASARRLHPSRARRRGRR